MSDNRYLHPDHFKYIERELYDYSTLKRELNSLREDIYYSTGCQEVCVQSSLSSTVENKAVKLTASAVILHLEKSINAIDKALARLGDDHRMLFDLRYGQCRSWQRVFMEMPCDERTCYRKRKELVFMVAEVMGFRFSDKKPRK